MAIILYINNEHCTSMDQLKRYFSEDLTLDSDIYADLLDYGRHGEIAEWLREMGEPELASKVETIALDLSDSAFYVQLKAAITGSSVKPNPVLKPTFDKCFSFEDVKCDVLDNEAKVTVSLKILMCVNEEYELSVSSNWGTRGMIIIPYSHPEGKTASFVFTFRKRPGKDVGEVTVKADGEVLADAKVLPKSVNNSDEFHVGDVRFKMIHVEGGTFKMGATCEQEHPNDDEKPVHLVTLSSYSIGETPVTQELWQAVMGSNPSTFKGAQRPVERVSWTDCQVFIKKLKQKTGKNFRLPTEAEWEFAARGGILSKGYKYSGSDKINNMVAAVNDVLSFVNLLALNYQTCPVKTRQPNELGIYDMSGNVREWCQDWRGRYTSSSQTNPKGPNRGRYRVVRGGSCCKAASFCRLSRRDFCSPDTAHNDLGLRLALSE